MWRPIPTKVSDLAKNVVGTLVVVLADIDSRTATTMTTNADGTQSVKGGILTGDTSTSQFRNQLMQAATYPVNGVSPSSVGIILGKDGSVTFDADKFAAALKSGPRRNRDVRADALAASSRHRRRDLGSLRGLADQPHHQPGLARQGIHLADRGLGHAA